MKKICVPVCALRTSEFLENIKRAESVADIIELRFDCLEEDELEKVLHKLENLSCSKPFLATFRIKEQGGKREISLDKRMGFWQKVLSKNIFELVDFENDLKTEAHNIKPQVIRSFHDFSPAPQNLNEVYRKLSQDSDIVKIAVQADDITDSIPIWKLLETAKKENKQFIPIAMSEVGKWTRILGLAFGSPVTYASLDEDNETASGQISAKDLIETYRVKELDKATEIYGVIGNPVSHSASPVIQNAAFKFHKLNAVYIPFEVKNLDAFLQRMVKEQTREIKLNFKGFSVTIPHKTEIIKHLDFVDETAKKIGAVNTVKIIDGKFYGYNTDAEGFIKPLRESFGNLKDARVAILGNGGAARSAIYALKKEGASVCVFARDIKKTESFQKDFDVRIQEFPIANRKIQFANFDIIVNATPLGMKGVFEMETPATAEQIKGVKLVYDLVYNPFETRLIQEVRKANVPTINGFSMFMAQGAAQFKIWTGLDAPMEEMTASTLES